MERESQAVSVQSTEPSVGYSLATQRSGPESEPRVRHSTDYTTQVALNVSFQKRVQMEMAQKLLMGEERCQMENTFTRMGSQGIKLKLLLQIFA